MTTDERRVDLVFQGGGVKGIALVGAYSVLSEEGYRPQNVAGTSAGAIVATLIAAGYTADELEGMLAETPFSTFLDGGWEDRIPFLGAPLSILLDQGIHEGRAFDEWMRERLAAKGVGRFGDLVVPEFADDARYRHRVQVVASDVTARRLLVLPMDAPSLGIEPDEMDVALAVRMSMSIPIVFEPVRHRAPDGTHVIVDGGMLSNFPVWLFDSEDIPDWPTFGLKLVDPGPREPVVRSGLGAFGWGPFGATVDYLTGLVATMVDAHDKLHLERSDFVRTIPISNLGVEATAFDLSRDRMDDLFEEGRRAARVFLETWDFSEYVREFRSGD